MNIKQSLYLLIAPLRPILSELQQAGATSYLVGGVVRDLVLGHQAKDVDIELHGLLLEQVQIVLEKFGAVSLVGKQFGVFRLHGVDVDWSLPRTDSKGRKPDVSIDPHMTFDQAARRRDITMNAMGINLNEVIADDFSSEPTIVDPYDGLGAIKKRKLCAVDSTLFLEDPLRFYRVMQFVARFEMTPDDTLQRICKIMDLTGIAAERIEEELKKLFLKSRRPSLGFRWVLDLSRLAELFPELYDTVGVAQKPEYHPEGDVFEHLMQSLDAAAGFTYENDREKLFLTIAALCHDLGKPATTKEDLTCHGHDDAGVPIAKAFLKRFTRDQELITVVTKLVKYHMRPFLLPSDGAKLSAYKRLAAKLAPEITMQQLATLARADSLGANPHGPEPLKRETMWDEDLETFLRNAEQAEVKHQPEPPVLQGRDLLDVVDPGPQMGALLKQAYEIQLEEEIKDSAILKRRVLKNL